MVTSVRTIQDFYDDVVHDPLLADLFLNVDIAELAELQTDVLMTVMGGRANHSRRQIRSAQRRVPISEEQFALMIQHLERQLSSHGFEPADASQIVTAYRRYRTNGRS